MSRISINSRELASGKIGLKTIRTRSVLNASSEQVAVSTWTTEVDGPARKRQVRSSRLSAEDLNGSDRLELFVFGKTDLKQAVLVARLDNLGKGAAGAAVQNIRLMLGLGDAMAQPTVSAARQPA